MNASRRQELVDLRNLIKTVLLYDECGLLVSMSDKEKAGSSISSLATLRLSTSTSLRTHHEQTTTIQERG